MENRKSLPILRPTTQKNRVVLNLLEAMDTLVISHGAHQLTGLDASGSESIEMEHVWSPLTTHIGRKAVSPHNCKDAPRKTKCSSVKKGNSVLKSNDSCGWYRSCNSQECLHNPHSVIKFSGVNQLEEAWAKYVRVLPTILGFSLTSNGG